MLHVSVMSQQLLIVSLHIWVPIKFLKPTHAPPNTPTLLRAAFVLNTALLRLFPDFPKNALANPLYSPNLDKTVIYARHTYLYLESSANAPVSKPNSSFVIWAWRQTAGLFKRRDLRLALMARMYVCSSLLAVCSHAHHVLSTDILWFAFDGR